MLLFLNGLKSTASVGIYNVGFQFGNILGIIISAITQAYSPWYFQKIKNLNSKNREEIISFSFGSLECSMP